MDGFGVFPITDTFALEQDGQLHLLPIHARLEMPPPQNATAGCTRVATRTRVLLRVKSRVLLYVRVLSASLSCPPLIIAKYDCMHDLTPVHDPAATRVASRVCPCHVASVARPWHVHVLVRVPAPCEFPRLSSPL